MPSNLFEVLASKVMNVRIPSEDEERKDRKIILREKRLNKEKLVNIGVNSSLTRADSSRKKTKKKLLREVMVKIGLKKRCKEKRRKSLGN